MNALTGRVRRLLKTVRRHLRDMFDAYAAYHRRYGGYVFEEDLFVLWKRDDHKNGAEIQTEDIEIENRDEG